MSVKVLAKKNVLRAALGLGVMLLWPAGGATAQQDAGYTPQQRQNASYRSIDGEKVHVEHVQGRVYMLGGAGANITVQVGDEAVTLIDAGRSEMSEDVLRA